MQYLYQFLIIMGFTYLGEVLNRLIPLPIPAAVYGLVLLFLGLSTGLVKLKAVETAGNWMIGIMSILYVAPVVNLLSYWDLIAPNLVSVAVIVVVSTAAVFGIAGKVTQWLLGRKENGHE